jgi:putative FmdB family regulatory protein
MPEPTTRLRHLIMPIHEYRCRGCHQEFEEIVLQNSTPRCPACHGEDLERMLSSFGVSSDGTRRTHLNAEKRKAAKVQRDKRHAEHEHMHKHQH